MLLLLFAGAGALIVPHKLAPWDRVGLIKAERRRVNVPEEDRAAMVPQEGRKRP